MEVLPHLLIGRKYLEAMRASKYIGFILLGLLSCTESFNPEINERQDMMVINGKITDKAGDHFVEVSRASPYNEPEFLPVSSCVVRVEDDGGVGVTYEEYEPGRYRAYLGESFLGINRAYKLFVFTEDGKEYQSDYDSLLACPSLDSVYFSIENQSTEDPDITYGGIQFYVDARGENWQAKNYLWELEETYEYHSPYEMQYLWSDGRLVVWDPPIDTLSICYKTQQVQELYTASTRGLILNDIKHFPLNYVSGSLPKLKYKYSLLVSQHSLSNDAFQYWDNMRNMQNESGGIYETQPSSSVGNIYNLDDEKDQVLGYFYASQSHQISLIINNSFEFKISDYSCPAILVELFSELSDQTYLVSLSAGGFGPPYGDVNSSCVDCRGRGGGTTPPSYWYNYE